MRRSIHLTGRRQLPQSGFAFRLDELGDEQIASLVIQPEVDLKAFPPDAEIRVRLHEHGLVRVLRFGTVASTMTSTKLPHGQFRAPSCQVRLVLAKGDNDGKLLGSTKPWTYTGGGQEDGLLDFQAFPTKPALWRLDIRDEGRPLLYVDERIENAGVWARNNPVFIACVFPHVISEIIGRILAVGSAPEDGWMADWMIWANSLMPGSKPPYGEPLQQRTDWIAELNDAFAHRHDLADTVLASMTTERAA